MDKPFIKAKKSVRWHIDGFFDSDMTNSELSKKLTDMGLYSFELIQKS